MSDNSRRLAIILVLIGCLVLLMTLFVRPARALDVSARMEIIEIREGTAIHLLDHDGEEYIYYHPHAEESFYVGQHVFVLMHFVKIDSADIGFNQLFRLNYVTIPMMHNLHITENNGG